MDSIDYEPRDGAFEILQDAPRLQGGYESVRIDDPRAALLLAAALLTWAVEQLQEDE